MCGRQSSVIMYEFEAAEVVEGIQYSESRSGLCACLAVLCDQYRPVMGGK